MKKSKIIFSSIAGAAVFATPLFALVSCKNTKNQEDDPKSEIDKLKKNITTLKQKIAEVESKYSTLKNDLSYKEAKKIISEVEKEKIEELKSEKIIKLNEEIEKFSKEIQNKINENEDVDPNTGKPKLDKELKYSDEEFKSDVAKLSSDLDLEKDFIFSLNSLFGGNNKSNIYASQLQNEATNIVLKFTNDSLSKKIYIKVINVILEDNANMTGKAKLIALLTNKSTGTTQNKEFSITGLAKSPYNQDRDGKYPNNKKGPSNNPKKDEISKYIDMDQKQRYQSDNKKYIDSLKKYLELSGIKSFKDLRPDLNATNEQKNTYDELAKTLGQDSYESAAYKGFSLVSYKSDGKVDGLEIGSEMGKTVSWVDQLGQSNPFQINGLARMIINDHYLRIAKQTFSISFSNYNDFQKEIFEKEKAIEHWKNSANDLEYKKLIDKKIAELQKLKEQAEQRWNKAIADNKDSHLTETLQKQKQEELDKISKEIETYNKRTTKDEIDLLEKQIKELKEKADSKRYMSSESGTMWIMDYQIDESKKNDPNWYPTKWYFGTNSHVAKAITDKLHGFSITKIRPDIKVGQKLRISQMDDNIVDYIFDDSSAIRTVFDGTDYLNSKPSDFLSEKQKEKFKDVEEFADFAVIEIDFSKIKDYFASSNSFGAKDSSFKESDSDFANKLAKLITNDYANENNKTNHIKFRKKSYLYDYDAIDFPLKGNTPNTLDQLYIVGWPSSREDYYLKPYIDDDQRKAILRPGDTNFSLWINSQSIYYDAKFSDGSFPKEKLERGDWLSYQLGYRTFVDKPGLIDTFIGAPKLGDDLYYKEGKRYVNMALAYSPRRYAPIGGSSGSSVRNQHNELVSAYYATNKTIYAGLSVAFRSEGFDYKGLYGKYNLPQYDLIYGGGKEQKNSYREALNKLYNSENIKTNLFSNGLNEVPSDFEFKNTD